VRILLVSDVPLVRELGAGRVQLEAAEEMRRLGHTVTTYDSRDAFEGEAPKFGRLRPLAFAARVRSYIRRHAGEFDVIDALQANAPFSKRELAFDGLLVTRSTGLHPLYLDYTVYERSRWPDRLPGSRAGRGLQRWNRRRIVSASAKSYGTSDMIRVLNDDEREYLSTRRGVRAQIAQLPEGLPDAHLDALANARRDLRARLANKEVVVLGGWGLRKGAADWPAILDRLRELVPEAEVLFLGTGVSESVVFGELGTSAGDRVRVVPSYASEQLPALLAPVTVGALPTYVEGYGLGIVEQLAAGVPSIAYDVPGPRTLLRRDPGLLAPRGDTAAFAERVAEVLLSTPERYETLVERSLAIAGRHRLSVLVPQLLSIYEEALDALPERRAPS
jgi:glycosyltransferase involved in cell wall biosynthesis